jgi:hypothetical protein
MILPFTVGVFPKSEVRLGRLDELVLSSSKNVELIAAPRRENEGGMRPAKMGMTFLYVSIVFWDYFTYLSII